MSCSSVNLAIVVAILKLEKTLGSSIVWKHSNKEQWDFLKNVFVVYKDFALKIPEAKAESSVTQRGEVRNISIGATFDLLVNWAEEGRKVKIIRNEGEENEKIFDGVAIKNENVSLRRYDDHPYPVAELKTKTGDTVCMSMYDETPLANELEVVVKKITTANSHSCYMEFSGLHFPMVDLVDNPDISFLEGMNTIDSEDWPTFITKAKQETKLKVNEKGAHIRSKVLMNAISIGCSGAKHTPPPHIINRPFLIWFRREGINVPLGIVYATTEDWKDPKTLDI